MMMKVDKVKTGENKPIARGKGQQIGADGSDIYYRK
jgi:hypothetical protein